MCVFLKNDRSSKRVKRSGEAEAEWFDSGNYAVKFFKVKRCPDISCASKLVSLTVKEVQELQDM